MKYCHVRLPTEWKITGHPLYGETKQQPFAFYFMFFCKCYSAVPLTILCNHLYRLIFLFSHSAASPRSPCLLRLQPSSRLGALWPVTKPHPAPLGRFDRIMNFLDSKLLHLCPVGTQNCRNRRSELHGEHGWDTDPLPSTVPCTDARQPSCVSWCCPDIASTEAEGDHGLKHGLLLQQPGHASVETLQNPVPPVRFSVLFFLL